MDCLDIVCDKVNCIYCSFDCENKAQSFISSIELKKGEVIDIPFPYNTIIFVLHGCVKIENKGEDNFELDNGNCIVIPAGTDIVVSPRQDSSMVLYHLVNNYKLCSSFTFEKLFHLEKGNEIKSRVLNCNSSLQMAVESTFHGLKDMFQCSDYYMLKIDEILFLLCAYYSKEELVGLFSPLLSSDLPFKTFVFENYKNISSVEQFASLANMTKDGFIRKFKKIFGVTPGNWLIKNKMIKIKYELLNTNKVFKEISYDNGFSHVGSFSTFCSKNFGLSPSQIRATRNK